jgi:general secretion pathway protein C
LNPPPPTPTAPPQPPQPPPDPDAVLDAALDAGIKKIDDTHYQLKSDLLDKVLLNPMAVAKAARVVPAMKNGHPAGFKIYAVRSSSIFARLGIMNGDTLQAINGRSLDSADKALEAYTALRDARRLDLDLERHGAPLTITITITR